MKEEKKTIFIDESKNRGQRIRVARLLTNLSRSDFCHKYDINPNTLLSLELGRIKLSQQKMQQLLTAFNTEGISCTAQWISEGTGLPAHRFQEDYSNIIVSEGSQKEINEEAFSIFQEIELFKKGSDRAIIMLIQDDAMLPWYELGDYVGGKLVDEQDILNLSGEICLIEIESDKFIVRHLFHEKNNFILSAINPQSKLCMPLIVKPHLMRVAKIFWHRKSE